MLPKRGRPGKMLLLTTERALTADDIVRLASGAGAIKPISAVQVLKAAHHKMARLVASGASNIAVGEACGVTPQRISDLRTKDPAFKELVSFYQREFGEHQMNQIKEHEGRLLDVATNSLEEIQERLNDPKKLAEIPIGELRQLATMGLDRTTSPPKTATPMTQTPVAITFNMGNRDLQKAQTAKIIDHEGKTETQVVDIDL